MYLVRKWRTMSAKLCTYAPVAEHYFEMSHVDASTALKIYKTFCRDTEKVVAYLGIAKKLQNVTNIPIPNLKHVRRRLFRSPLCTTDTAVYAGTSVASQITRRISQ